MTNFLHEPDMLNISLEEAGKMVSYYWGGAMVGRFVGSGLLFLVQAARALVARGLRARRRACCASPCRRCTAPPPAYLALSIGLFNSIMFPVIFTLDARAFDRRTRGDVGPAVPRDRRRRDPAVHLWLDRGRGRPARRVLPAGRWRT